MAAPNDDESAIAAVRNTELAAFSSGDLEHFLTIVADDVVFDPWIGPAKFGRAGTTELFNAMLSHSTFTATYDVEELQVLGDWAFDRGIWNEEISRRQASGEVAATFGVLQMYRKDPDGTWKLARSIWNKKTGGDGQNYITLAKKTTAVHNQHDEYDIYIGRAVPEFGLEASKWGNPFVMEDDSDEERDRAISEYREWIVRQPELMASLGELQGQRLGCWCAPKPCHGNVLAELADTYSG